MRKILLVVSLFAGVLALAGCDMLGGGGSSDIWYDQYEETLHISYNLGRPDTNEETGETIPEYYFLMAKDNETNEWFEITQLDNYSEDDLQIEYRFDQFGDIDIKIEKRDAYGAVLSETIVFTVYLEEPQYIYHFNVNFDSWNGVVYFDFGVNEQVVKNFIIEKSEDGGINWIEVMNEEVVMHEDGYVKNQYQYYEYNEGSYVYRMLALDSSGAQLGEINSWGEINVQYNKGNYEGNPDMYYVDAAFDIWSRNVNIWWDAAGAFDEFLIEKSVDGETWMEVGRVPRFVSSFNYHEDLDGEYFYRVSALVGDDVMSEHSSETQLRVADDILIGYFDGWIDWQTQVIHLSWEFNVEEEVIVIIERRTEETDFEYVEEFGGLKKMYEDEGLLPGTYYYRVIIENLDGTVLDSVVSEGFTIEPPQNVHHLNAWFDSAMAEIELSFGMNFDQVDHYVIEKSMDGGLTWEVYVEEQVEYMDGWYKDRIRVMELNEGSYMFRITGYDVDGNFQGEAYSWNEILVEFNHNFEGTPEVYYIDAYFDPTSRDVDIWWDAAGAFDEFLVEKSLDGETWEEVGRVPRFITRLTYNEMVDGQYVYRVSAILDTLSEDDVEMEHKLRVQDNIIIQHINGWVEWDSQTIYIDWGLNGNNFETIRVERKMNDGEFELLGDFGEFKQSYQDDLLDPGTYIYRISALDIDGNVVDSLESFEFFIEQPDYVHHLNAWFNESTGHIEFNFGFDANKVTNFVIEKSSDGGLTWVEFYSGPTVYSDEFWYESHLRVYELEEGTYAYRLIGYNDAMKKQGEEYSYNEIVVDYQYLNLEEPTDIYHLDGNYNIWDNTVNLWWNSQGDYENHVIEYSLDEITWTEVKTVPRVATFTQIQDLADGVYFFRIKAVALDGTVKDVQEANDTVRVKLNAQIGNFYGHVDWNEYQVNLYWDIIKDDVAIIRVERKLVEDTEFTLLGNFGPLKSAYVDDLAVTGTYVYKLTLLDQDGNIIDEMESTEFYVEIPTT